MPTGNRVPFRNPIVSYSTPPTEGPTNAPREKKEAQSPATIPYVVMSSGNPLDLQETQVPVNSTDIHIDKTTVSSLQSEADGPVLRIQKRTPSRA
jgi:hypothetical protein